MMRAVRFLDAGKDLEVTSLPVPTPAWGESLISVKAVGICGSDLHNVQGHTPTAYTPITLGHEISGVVEAINGENCGISVGERVFVNPMVGCGRCRFCAAGETSFCAERSILGIQREGALAEFIVAPTYNLTVMPGTIGFPEIALIESAGTANNAVRTLEVSKGDNIAVVGAGGLGMQVLRLAVARGARVVAIDTDPAARARCLEAGAWKVVDPATSTVATPILREIELNTGLDCVGNDSTFALALNLLRINGHCAVVGIGAQPLQLSPPANFMRRALRVSGIYGYTNSDIREVSDCLISGTLDLKASVSALLPLEAAGEGIKMFADRRKSPVRIIIQP